VLFLTCLFFAPLAQSIPVYATASALLFVACLMIRSLADLDWDDLTECAPAVVTAMSMPLAFSIADGLGIGFISYAVIKIISGKSAACSIAVYAIATVFVAKFAFLN
jgi:AGZA family xanthine/uracil permease-like MFS transporter